MHSGTIAGGGDEFRAWCDETQHEAFDDTGTARSGFIVLPVNRPTSGHSLFRFIEWVKAYRGARRNNEIELQNRGYRPFYHEPRGWRATRGAVAVEYLSRHGDVVDELRIWRQKRPMEPSCRIGKNGFIDMGVIDARGSLIELYEVKTSVARPDVYSGIGQLMVHGTANSRRFLVLPENDEALQRDLANAIERLEIGLLRFSLDGTEPVIRDSSAGVRVNSRN